MPNVQEIPQQIPPITLPQIWKPNYDPRMAQMEALQAPDIDPVMALAMAAGGGIPGLFARAAENAVAQTAMAPLNEPGIMPPPVRPAGAPTGILPRSYPYPRSAAPTGELQGLETGELSGIPTSAPYATTGTGPMPEGGRPPIRGGIPYDVPAYEYAAPEADLDNINPPPGYMVPGYYNPDVRARAEGAGRLFSQPKTTPFYDAYGAQTTRLDPEDLASPRGGEPYPPYHYLDEDIASRFGHPSGGPPSPERMLWHGLSLYEEPKANMQTLESLQNRSYGLSGGWFGQTPVGHFGPFYVGANPEDLPPTEMVPKWMREDPAVQLSPKYPFSERKQIGIDPVSRYERVKLGKKLPPSMTETASGRSIPDISIHPSKLHVIDKAGNYYGTVAEQRPGLKPTAPFSSEDIESMFTKFGRVLKDLPEEIE